MLQLSVSARTRNGLLAAGGVLFLIAVMGFMLNNHAEFRASVVNQTHGQLLTTAKSISLSIRELVDVLSDSLVSAAGNKAVQQALQSGNTDGFPFDEIDALREAHQVHASALYVLDAAGRVIHRSPASSAPGATYPTSLADRPDVSHVLLNRVPYVSRPFTNTAGKLVITTSVPIFSGGEFVGIARWSIGVKTLADHFLKPVRVGKSGYALLMDASGALLWLSDEAQIGRPILEKPERLFPGQDWSGLQTLLQSIQTGVEGTGTADMVCWLSDEHRDQITTKLVAHAPVRIGDSLWSVVMSIDREEIWLPIRSHALSQFVMFGLVLAVIALAGQRWLASQRSFALISGERKFRALFKNMAEGVALHEVVRDGTGAATDYRILEINPAYTRHTGLAADVARGALASRLYGTSAPPYLEEFAAVADGGPPYFFETYFPPLGRHFSISVVSPREGRFATVFEDITAAKLREEELRQKNAELERFIYTISHDLKSPLVTIKTFLGYLEQDLDRADTAKIAQDIAYMTAAATRMGTLLDELLELSRVGRSVNPPSRVSFNELVEEARGVVAGRIAERGVRIWAHESEAVLFGDRRRLVEIWQNLIDNAVKYMGDQTAPSVEIGVETRGGEPVFFVRDNGAGIEPRYHDKVFGLFEKLDSTSEGTGLGLALVRRIVELYRGTIRVESEGLGKGSCFFFTLPGAIEPKKPPHES